MKKVRLPQYLHLPIQFLWFDSEELMIIVVMYIFATVFGGYSWFLMIIVPYLYMQYKRNKPRGYLRHLIFLGGIYTLKNYPGPHGKRFSE